MYSYIEPELGASLSNSLQHIVNNSVNYVYDEQPDASSRESGLAGTRLTPRISSCDASGCRSLAWQTGNIMDRRVLPES